MRVLVVSNLYPPDFLGGYELACGQAAEGLRTRGHEVLVLTANPRQPVPDEPGVLRRLRMVDVYDAYYNQCSHPVHVGSREFEGYAVQAANVRVVAQTIEEFDPDVAYVHNVVALGGLGVLAAVQQMNVPWVMHLGDCVPKILCGLGRAVRPEMGAAFVRAVRGRFLCVSQTLLDEIADAGIDLSGKARLLPYWVATAGSPDRRRFFRPREMLRVVTSGALGEHKGTDLLIRAVALLRDRGCANVTVDCYGPGPEADFRGLALRLGVADRVKLCGIRPQTELHAKYPGYDLFAFPTLSREPFGIAPMEAAAHGCVPLVSDRCGYGEWFAHGVHCLKAERSAEGFADAIRAVLSGQVNLPALARRSMAVTLRDFHLRAVLPAIEEELQRAARSRTDRRRPSADEVYRLGILAEKAFPLLIQEAAEQPSAVHAEPIAPARETVEVPVDVNFFDHTSRGLARAPLTITQRALRRVLRPMFHRLRDLLHWLHHQDLEQRRAIAELSARLAEAEAALARREAQRQAFEADHQAVTRRLAQLEDLILQTLAGRDEPPATLPMRKAA
ncbi:MAG TPA: glycosyltransferase family 4 protein [Fimbriiglobus sp.]|nr:glycosyltransferase family 4 protein [Fimbriiglobus sp.]